MDFKIVLQSESRQIEACHVPLPTWPLGSTHRSSDREIRGYLGREEGAKEWGEGWQVHSFSWLAVVSWCRLASRLCITPFNSGHPPWLYLNKATEKFFLRSLYGKEEKLEVIDGDRVQGGCVRLGVTRASFESLRGQEDFWISLRPTEKDHPWTPMWRKQALTAVAGSGRKESILGGLHVIDPRFQVKRRVSP
jgi:hypothetical protein